MLAADVCMQFRQQIWKPNRIWKLWRRGGRGNRFRVGFCIPRSPTLVFHIRRRKSRAATSRKTANKEDHGATATYLPLLCIGTTLHPILVVSHRARMHKRAPGCKRNVSTANVLARREKDPSANTVATGETHKGPSAGGRGSSGAMSSTSGGNKEPVMRPHEEKERKKTVSNHMVKSVRHAGVWHHRACSGDV
eukprot:1065499-Rhodomonas_salina.1